MMTSRDVAVVVLRVLGVLLVVQVLLTLVRVWGLYRIGAGTYGSQEDLRAALVGEWLWILVMMMVSGGLLLFSGRLATLIVRGEQPAPLNLTAGEAQSIAFSAVGLYLVCTALPSLTLNLYWYVELRRERPEYGYDFIANNVESVLRNTALLVLGLALFLGHRGVATMWRRLQPLRQDKVNGGPGAP